MTEDTYDVYWRGPYSTESVLDIGVSSSDNYLEGHEGFVLYNIYIGHPLYGENALVYIGMTEQSIQTRMKQHESWINNDRYGKAQIYLGSIGKFKSWEKADNTAIYQAPVRSVTQSIEELLIYCHQPAYNDRNKKSANSSNNIRIFNTGQFGALMPELSGRYEFW